MVTIKGNPTPVDMNIISSIVDRQAKNIEFKNISFYCESIKDALGNVFVKRKTGRWLKDSHGVPYCSECGFSAPFFEKRSFFSKRLELIPSKFCWQCGVKIEGEITTETAVGDDFTFDQSFNWKSGGES